MAMSLETALGRPIETIEDAVLAMAAFPFAKHGHTSDFLDAEEAARNDIDQMTNSEFLSAIALGFQTLAERKQ